MGTPEVERALRQWLENHEAVIGRLEALRLGASESDVRTRLRRGEWAQVYPGVYVAAGAPTTAHQALRAAYVALGGRAVASHRSAAWLWDLVPTPPEEPELTAPRSRYVRTLEGIAVHRSQDLGRSVPSSRLTIPLTNPLRTLVDLASVVSPERLTEAVDHAVSRRLVTVEGLVAEIGRLSRHGRPGTAPLRAHLLGRGFIGAPAPSVLEAKFLRLVVGTGLPHPEVEHVVEIDGVSYRIDIAWPVPRLALEAEGFVWHWSPEAKRRGEIRRRRLERQGWTVLVYNWWEIVNEASRVAREITET